MADEIKNEEVKEEVKEETKEQETPQKDELTELKEKLADANDKYLRTLAEMDNLRKRISREKEEFMKFAKAEIAREFLPVLDNLERAANNAIKANDLAQLKDGLDMVVKQFVGIIEKMGMTLVPDTGHFDPDMHFVVHKEETHEKDEGHIIETFQKGYMMDGKVVRHAMVKVAAKPSKDDKKPEDKDKK